MLFGCCSQSIRPIKHKRWARETRAQRWRVALRSVLRAVLSGEFEDELDLNGRVQRQNRDAHGAAGVNAGFTEDVAE